MSEVKELAELKEENAKLKKDNKIIRELKMSEMREAVVDQLEKEHERENAKKMDRFNKLLDKQDSDENWTLEKQLIDTKKELAEIKKSILDWWNIWKDELYTNFSIRNPEFVKMAKGEFNAFDFERDTRHIDKQDSDENWTLAGKKYFMVRTKGLDNIIGVGKGYWKSDVDKFVKLVKADIDKHFDLIEFHRISANEWRRIVKAIIDRRMGK